MKKNILLAICFLLITKIFSQKSESFSMISLKNSQGINSSSFGISFYNYSSNNRSKWSIPWVLSISSCSLRQNYFNQFNYKSAKFDNYVIGLKALKNVKKNIWYILGMELPGGTEILVDNDDKKIENFVIGVKSTQGFFYIPQSKYGMTFSIGFYEQLLTSVVYRWDVGLTAELGFKF